MNDQTHDPGGVGEEQSARVRTAAVASEQPALTRPDPRARPLKWILIAVVIVAAAVSGWLWFGQGPADQAKAKGKGDPNARPMPVAAAPGRNGTIDLHL